MESTEGVLYTLSSPLLLRVLHPEREQGEGTPLLWRDRGPLDPWEMVIKVVFQGLWRETGVAQGV